MVTCKLCKSRKVNKKNELERLCFTCGLLWDVIPMIEEGLQEKAPKGKRIRLSWDMVDINETQHMERPITNIHPDELYEDDVEE